MLFSLWLLLPVPAPAAGPPDSGPGELRQLQEMKYAKDENRGASGMSGIREQALNEAAMRLGACRGANWEYARLEKRFEEESSRLDEIFNFSPLMIGGNVIPPVITEIRDAAQKDGRETLRTAQVMYEIVQFAQVATVPPNWRQYLLARSSECQPPVKALLPKNDEEQKAWSEAIKRGWDSGVEAADTTERERLRKLVIDLTGMIRFNVLKQRGQVSAVLVAGSGPRVVVEGKELRVGERLFRIARDADFQPETKWRPVVRDRYLGGL